MKRLIAFGLVLNAALIGFRAWQEAAAQADPGPEGNGDVNGDGDIDVSDASYLLNWLFLSGPEPVPIVSCPPRFLDDGDGTITDTSTGRMWLRQTVDVNGDGVRDDHDSITKSAAEELADGFELGGYSDWTLPSTRELTSLVELNRESGIDPSFALRSGFYWIGSTNAGDPCHGCNFALEFGEDRTTPGFVTVHGDYDSSYTAHVLLVRRP